MRARLKTHMLLLLLTAMLCVSFSSCVIGDAAVTFVADVIIQHPKAALPAVAQEPPSPSDTDTAGGLDDARVNNYTLNCGNYTTAEVMGYFIDTVFYTESDGYIGVVRKLSAPVTYAVRGEYTDEDIAQIEYLADFLNGVDGFPGISECTSGAPDIDIVFGTLEYLDEYEDMYENSYGSVSFTWDNDSCEIISSYVRIVSDMVGQYDRNHIILEEIIQGLGLGNDTWTYEESLFYEGWNAPQTVPFIDELLIRALYCREMKAGMNEDEAAAVLRGLFGVAG